MYRILLGLTAIIATTNGAAFDWRILGGTNAEDGKFPHHASIQYQGAHNCGGSILNSRWILTAAHCVVGAKPEEIKVVVGTNKLNKPGDIYQVESLIAHEDYHVFQFDYDVGLVKLAENIRFNDKVKPIKLNTNHVDGSEDVTLCGWGTTILGGQTPNDLQVIDLKTISEEDCKDKMGESLINSGHLCTLTKKGEGACHGDSGGALLHGGKVAGIVSFGRPCAQGYPDVFTRVSQYQDWIESNMK